MLCCAVLLAAVPALAQSVPTSVSYQGKLTTPSGAAVPDGDYQIIFNIYEAETGGSPVYTSTVVPVTTHGGLCTCQIPDLYPWLFADASDYWLELSVAPSGGDYSVLSPRTKLLSVPFAFRADDLTLPFYKEIDTEEIGFDVYNNGGTAACFVSGPSSSGDALWASSYGTGQVAWFGSWNSENPMPALYVTNEGTGPTIRALAYGSGLAGDFLGTVQMTGFKLPVSPNAGYVLTSDSAGVGTWQAPPSGGGSGWSLTGNSGTDPSTNFVGTTDPHPLTIKANSYRCLQLSDAIRSAGGSNYWQSVNVLGGHQLNSITPGVIGATISGGGEVYYPSTQSPNVVTDEFGTIAGGASNQAGDNSGTTWDMTFATVSGGYGNVASGNYSTVLGGRANTASGYSSVAGGSNSQATGGSSFAIGYQNTAAGAYSFAAGYNAKALNNGSFVWSDSSGSGFQSTADNQFLIRALGGVGIGTASPDSALHVYTFAGQAAHFDSPNFAGTGVYARGGANGGKAAIFEGNVQVRSRSTGSVIIEFGEGLDYSEGFDVAGGSAEPGSVLVIDRAHPGRLALSSKPYDTCVAGIVTGANNLGSAVKVGSGRYAHSVALAGRVYCNVDATRCAVEPGDLLTTSSTRGYAMKAADYRRAHGTILGKAMQRLTKGTKGQILVLVTLE
jgi:hypothetical protein